jgi:hypothetical protein
MKEKIIKDKVNVILLDSSPLSMATWHTRNPFWEGDLLEGSTFVAVLGNSVFILQIFPFYAMIDHQCNSYPIRFVDFSLSLQGCCVMVLLFD